MDKKRRKRLEKRTKKEEDDKKLNSGVRRVPLDGYLDEVCRCYIDDNQTQAMGRTLKG